MDQARGGPNGSSVDQSPRLIEPVVDDAVSASRTSQTVAEIEQLRKRGRFAEFVDLALNTAAEVTDSAAVELVKSEALLAVGRDAEAEEAAGRAAEIGLSDRDRDLWALALRRWATACFRQAKSLDAQWLRQFVARSPEEPTARMLLFWAEALGERSPYRVSDSGQIAHALAASAAGSDAAGLELNAVQARAGGISLEVVFIDTGAQHVIMTGAAAEAAGVRIGPSGLRLVGFAPLVGRPGVLDSLALGDLTVYDVPVLVGDSPALVAAGGQMAIGTELMHHVRFTLDYPAGRVDVEAASRRSAPTRPRWQIPLWTFSQSCLAQGELPDGALARVLIDTGDRTGTYVSTRWAQRHLRDFPRSRGPVVFKYKRQDLALARMDLGSRSLVDWPVLDTLPADLERIDAVDVLVGRDLLGSYRATFDLARRVLQLSDSATATSVETTAQEPASEAQTVGETP
jgi:hypothetical protein